MSTWSVETSHKDNKSAYRQTSKKSNFLSASFTVLNYKRTIRSHLRNTNFTTNTEGQLIPSVFGELK